ncbi:MAG TPA: methionyl-tRNA formyltransferase [Planctomycetaceae bacterium]|nr:methionyl-tRNA formyltransferase [Planctomycetaceae bacterium]
MALRLVMMATGGFALPTFRALLDQAQSNGNRVVGLFTQPDRVGRGHHRHVNPLKELALGHGIPVFQPEKANTPEAIASLAALIPDLCVVAAYGQILSPALLAVPRLGAINVHASILPKYRGAAPIQTAILCGETETGVTIFQIEPKLDAGPILAIARTPIGEQETAGELESRLAILGAELAVGVVEQLAEGTAEPIVQDSSRASRAPRLKKEDGRIDWNRSPRQIDCQVRAFQPWPLAYSTLVMREGKTERGNSPRSLRLIVLEVAPAEQRSSGGSAAPGTILAVDNKRLVVQAAGGALEISRLQPEGKRAMTAAEFLAGYPVRRGDRFEG